MVPRMPRSHLTHALIIQKTQIENTTNKLKHKRPRLFNILPPNRFPQAERVVQSPLSRID
jgi:hypothetical protein